VAVGLVQEAQLHHSDSVAVVVAVLSSLQE
jgi:hypothetical protein